MNWKKELTFIRSKGYSDSMISSAISWPDRRICGIRNGDTYANGTPKEPPEAVQARIMQLRWFVKDLPEKEISVDRTKKGKGVSGVIVIDEISGWQV